jgi:E3 ubiquitin-protein ligase RAD18
MAETVSDPTDWNDTKLPFISSLDAALRCEVCKEFYTAPMITTCCHTFCSLCIRKALHNDGKCPLCRSPGQECHLRKNTTVQDLLDAFVGCREKLFEFATTEAAPIPRVEDENTPSSSQPSVRPRRSRRRAVSSESNDDDPQPVEPAPPPGLCSRPSLQIPVLMFTR